MARAYSETRCTVCGKHVSRNGLATTAHKGKHVKQGLMSDSRFDITTEGQAVAQETAASIRQLSQVMQAARAAYNAVPDTDPAWTGAYAAMTTAETEYREYVHPAGK